MEINVEFDKNDSLSKMNNLKNKFEDDDNSFEKFQNLLKNIIRNLNNKKEENYFNNLQNDNNL